MKLISPFLKLSYNIELDNLADDYGYVVDSYVEYLTGLTNELDPENDTDLLNIRDTMLGELNRLKYLLTLN